MIMPLQACAPLSRISKGKKPWKLVLSSDKIDLKWIDTIQCIALFILFQANIYILLQNINVSLWTICSRSH
jgi:hypothetical protein